VPRILTTNATITCPHGGSGTTIPTLPKWQIDGGYVCVEEDTGTLACPFVTTPCVGYILKSMGLNATKIDDKKVILETDFNQTLTGLPLTIVERNKVVDQSTPAAIPAGEEAPPQSEELTDLVPPVVVAMPPTFPFKITPPPTPVPVQITFTLTGNHPLQWVLTLIKIPATGPGTNFDLTNGIPGNATVVPFGGEWRTTSLTVSVTLTPTYVASLGPGSHELYMIGVSKRGISGHIKAVIVVSP